MKKAHFDDVYRDSYLAVAKCYVLVRSLRFSTIPFAPTLLIVTILRFL